MIEQYPAHIRITGQNLVPQSCKEHCKKVAAYASKLLQGVDLQNCGELIGLLHDSGKYTEAFASYITRAASGEAVRRGSVNHSSAGLRFLLSYRDSAPPDEDTFPAELLAYAIGAHHGLFDCVTEQHQNGFLRRSEQAEDYNMAMQRFFESCCSERELNNLYRSAQAEILEAVERLVELTKDIVSDDTADQEILFYLGLLSRLLLSALIDADRRDTAEFMLGLHFPQWPEDRRIIWKKCREHLEQKLKIFPTETPIQNARSSISEQCATFAEKPEGVYRLNVPTGAGKTLSALRYALVHAEKWNKRRLIFTSPLLSILEQNAQVIRDYVGDDSLILEHHSNVVTADGSGDALNEMELLTETWSAPIIITTLVQLLNTFFSGKSDCIRRFHSLCDAVIVIDEVQTVPSNMLTLFNLTVNFLSQVCHTTVILCSATQPELGAVSHPLFGSITEMVPYFAELWTPFHRTEFKNAGNLRFEEIPAQIINALEKSDSVLVVCNKKGEASALYREMEKTGVQCYHLSASMCVQHRRYILDKLKNALKESKSTRKKVLCISTQVIEAGVDISFAHVIRFNAGMDSIVQAAGRCNRNGECETPALVQIINCVDENLKKLTDIQRGKDATLSLLYAFDKEPERFDGKLSSAKAIGYYYRQFYSQMKQNEQDYPVGDVTLFDLLGENAKYTAGYVNDDYTLRQAFQTAGKLFAVFDDDTETVIVPFENGRAISEQLIAEDRKFPKDYRKIAELVQMAKPYTVSLRRYEINDLDKLHAIIDLFDGNVRLLSDGFYDKNTGFSVKNIDNCYQEV